MVFLLHIRLFLLQREVCCDLRNLIKKLSLYKIEFQTKPSFVLDIWIVEIYLENYGHYFKNLILPKISLAKLYLYLFNYIYVSLIIQIVSF